MSARCGMFGHRWELFADADDKLVTIQKCARCGKGRRIRWRVEEGFWNKFRK